MALYNLLQSLPSQLHLPLFTSPTYTTWQPGVTPLSTLPQVVTALVVYLVVVLGGQELMRERKELKLKTLFQIHNIFLSAGSGLLLALMLEEIVPIIWNNGLFYSICNHAAWTPRLVQFYYINYLFKYIELIDTVFLVVKKKPLQFLHVFHHTATAALCFTQLNGRTSVSWVPITLNLTVHVLMYAYYFLTTTGRKVWWKKYLTTMQILQFVIDLVACFSCFYFYLAYEYSNGVLPTPGTCAGTEGAAAFGCGLLTSYLFLFIAFYKKTYKSEKSKKAAKAAAAAKARKEAIEGVADGVAPAAVKVADGEESKKDL